jgi:cysteine desulfurase / selenocysteine lyase
MAAAKPLVVKAKIVSVTHVSNVLGTKNDVKQLAQWVHQAGGILIVDGAQSAPHVPINVQDLDCDYFVCGGHKMYGPTGIGILYGKRELLKVLPPFLFGGDMISEVTFQDAKWNDLPWKFEAGTPPIAEAVGLGAAVEYLSALGMQNIEAYEADLLAYALKQLSTLKGIELYAPKTGHVGVISFNLKGIHPHDVATIVDRFGVAVRGGHHCAMPLMRKLNLPAACRASIGMYNTKADIDALISGLKEAQRIFA